jgi:hypothetical protein
MKRFILGLSVLPLLVGGASAGQPLSDKQMDLVVAAGSNPNSSLFSQAPQQTSPSTPGQTSPSGLQALLNQVLAMSKINVTLPTLSPQQTTTNPAAFPQTTTKPAAFF